MLQKSTSSEDEQYEDIEDSHSPRVDKDSLGVAFGGIDYRVLK